MSPEEQSLLSGLFERVRSASTTPRDREAETLIEQAVRAQPSAPYYLAQAVIVQEKGLEAAAQRIEALEAQLRRSEDRLHELEAGRDREPRDSAAGGFLGSLFGSSEKPQRRADAERGGEAYPADRPVTGGPWGSAPRAAYPSSPQPYQPPYQPSYQPPQQASSGGGFLRGAMGTAAGVAGGMLLANSLSGIFGNHMSSLGLGGATETVAPIEETTINNYYGDDAVTQASDGAPNTIAEENDAADQDGWQQADLDTSPNDDFDAGFGGDDTMDV
ncbi:hypothetical protein ASG25_16055 [Rhizobium sp. Leaf384]|uniref:DUF2076 domain-containing protein n=1 Tax=unclassified Rhizobium TaxID=2613769 RepID=UPI0007135D00|nr:MULTISPECIES: DUF2076 domain-containing protein [unclassified Rhizobium]KQS76920.1 hypothetical protein ASG25_16055 [Rhizobium sp. Leaf384]KQS78191.1 hypothetical protein ASG58_07270 [Rhizobium sp. Leaf383]